MILTVLRYCLFVAEEGIVFFFFKRRTAYELRIIDWSSDVCSSDLAEGMRLLTREWFYTGVTRASQRCVVLYTRDGVGNAIGKQEIGRASCRERVCQYV